MICLVIYKTHNGIKSRYVTTHVFLKPGDYTVGGWQLLSIGYYHDKKFIGKNELSYILNRHNRLHLNKIKYTSLLTLFFNRLLKILLFLFLVYEVIYKFFIYILK